MKKKYVVPTKDKEDWINFTNQIGNISPKEVDLLQKNLGKDKIPKLDLHGISLNEANKVVEKFVIKSFDLGFKKILIVTGKGLRSKSYNDPYVSEKLSVLRYSVPEFIKNNESLSKKISSISKADLKDGAEGAIYIFLKNNQ